jgi:hypothetical protein
VWDNRPLGRKYVPRSLPDVRDNSKSYHNGNLRATGPRLLVVGRFEFSLARSSASRNHKPRLEFRGASEIMKRANDNAAAFGMVGHNIAGSLSDSARGQHNWTRKNHRAWVCTLLACAVMAPPDIRRVWTWLPCSCLPRLFSETFKLTRCPAINGVRLLPSDSRPYIFTAML